MIRTTSIIDGLTTSSEKTSRYAVDPYFRDAWEELVGIFGTPGEVRRFTWRHVPLVLRPDAIAAGRGELLLDLLQQWGLAPVGHAEVRFDRHLVREVWRYQLNIATRDRITMMDRVLVDRPGLLILLRATRPTAEPVCLDLRARKGPSDPDRRTPDQLRHVLSAARASVLTLVHSPDEPIDVVRDLAVFLDGHGIRQLTAGPRPPEEERAAVLSRLKELRDETGHHELDLDTARLSLGLPTDPAGLARAAQRVLAEVLTARHVGSWDRLVVAAHTARTHFAGYRAAIPDTDATAWSHHLAPPKED
ncbi:hypothetical protein ACFYMW_30050 [Streptomyces sp. NPDC006692]|uniref:hypothetical protein n=1 Tax=Streptomyces sp. NPDC006692 TaxID=3364758 RepID=UPI0036873D13